jgi:hypothetical protein
MGTKDQELTLEPQVFEIIDLIVIDVSRVKVVSYFS